MFTEFTIGNAAYQEVKPCNYLGCVLNGDYATQEEIKDRITFVNRAYFPNFGLLEKLSTFQKCQTSVIRKRRKVKWKRTLL